MTEPRARVEPGNVRKVAPVNRVFSLTPELLGVCGPIECIVVDDDQFAISGNASIEFDKISPGGNGAAKSR